MECAQTLPNSYNGLATPYVPLPRYVYDRPAIADAIQALLPTISTLRKGISTADSNIFYELEARLGRWTGSQFVAGVDKEFFYELETRLEGFADWDSVDDHYTPSHVYTYRDNDRILRTTSTFIMGETHDQIEMQHLIKTSVAQETFQTVSDVADPLLYDVRISLAREEKVPVDTIREAAEPHHVRIKQRRSFFCRSTDNGPAVWKFDLTLSWSGSSRSEAETNQRNIPPIYEVEIECINPSHYLRDYEDARMATSLLLKVDGFFDGRPAHHLQPVQK